MTPVGFLSLLRSVRRRLPRQTILTLRGQALAGDIDGAVRGVEKLLRKA